MCKREKRKGETAKKYHMKGIKKGKTAATCAPESPVHTPQKDAQILRAKEGTKRVRPFREVCGLVKHSPHEDRECPLRMGNEKFSTRKTSRNDRRFSKGKGSRFRLSGVLGSSERAKTTTFMEKSNCRGRSATEGVSEKGRCGKRGKRDRKSGAPSGFLGIRILEQKKKEGRGRPLRGSKCGL